MTFTKGQVKTIYIALQDAIRDQEAFLDAIRDKYADPWKPIRGYRRLWTKTLKQIENCKTLQQKIQRENNL